MIRARVLAACALGLALLLCVACRQASPPAESDLVLDLQAADTIVGQTSLTITVVDAEGAPIKDARGSLSLRGDMSHAGMVPLQAEADAPVDGIYRLPFEWTMAGDWIVEATLKRPDGSAVAGTFEFTISAAEHSTASMEHEPSRGESSAVYLRVQNRGGSDLVFVSASSASAERVAFHRTIVEDGVARMEVLDELVVAAGQSLELQPGGSHLMLSGLKRDLLIGERFELTLVDDTGERYAMYFAVADSQMGGLDDEIVIGELEFRDRWARPAKAPDD